jgi:hypothetical protein
MDVGIINTFACLKNCLTLVATVVIVRMLLKDDCVNIIDSSRINREPTLLYVDGFVKDSREMHSGISPLCKHFKRFPCICL